jgi:CRP/FNR family cyclic AMP-dependent transcriptional regulator
MSGEAQLFEKFGKEFPAGYELFQEGDSGDEMYIIQTGKIRIVKNVEDGEKVLAVLPAGEFFGEMAILLNESRGAGAVVEEDAQLLVIDASTFEAMIKSNVEIAYRMIKKLAQRLQDTNAQIETMSLKDANRKVVYTFVRLSDRGEDVDGGKLVKTSVGAVANVTGLDVAKVNEIVGKLAKAGLLKPHAEGYVIADAKKLHKFLEFLAMKEQFGDM